MLLNNKCSIYWKNMGNVQFVAYSNLITSRMKVQDSQLKSSYSISYFHLRIKTSQINSLQNIWMIKNSNRSLRRVAKFNSHTTWQRNRKRKWKNTLKLKLPQFISKISKSCNLTKIMVCIFQIPITINNLCINNTNQYIKLTKDMECILKIIYPCSACLIMSTVHNCSLAIHILIIRTKIGSIKVDQPIIQILSNQLIRKKWVKTNSSLYPILLLTILESIAIMLWQWTS